MIKIRKAKNTDAIKVSVNVEACVLANHKEIYSQEHINHILWLYSPEKVKESIDDRDFWVAVDEKEVVGSVALKPHKEPNSGFMTALYVHPAHIGKGIGRKLVEHLEEQAKADGYKEIWLWSSLVAYDFYLHMDYVKIQDIIEDDVHIHVEMLKVLQKS